MLVIICVKSYAFHRFYCSNVVPLKYHRVFITCFPIIWSVEYLLFIPLNIPCNVLVWIYWIYMIYLIYLVYNMYYIGCITRRRGVVQHTSSDPLISGVCVPLYNKDSLNFRCVVTLSLFMCFNPLSRPAYRPSNSFE